MTTVAPAGDDSAQALQGGLLLYAITLLVIVLQNRFFLRRSRVSSLLFATNIELIVSLALFYFYFGAHRSITTLPQVGSSVAMRVLVTLVMYFGGLFIFYWTAYATVRPYRQPRKSYIAQQIRFIAPFAIPFALFSLLGDILGVAASTLGETLTTALSAGFLGSMMVFFPYVLVTAWQCKPLPESPMKNRLEELCKELKFTYSAMLTWPVMGNSLTAAIIGIIPRFRYVMFTPNLLEQLSPECVEAVLIHEVGHNRRKHLLIYPFIIAGAMVVVAYLSEILLAPIDSRLALKSILDPNGPWQALRPLLLFATYVAVMALYFRIVFGFFSRLFERQADLTIFDTDLPPRYMSQALDEVGYLSGNIHDHPSWHHYSIRQRMNFIERAEKHPGIVQKHHRRVKLTVIAYFLLLALTAGPMLYDKEWPSILGDKIDTSFNATQRKAVAEKFIKEFGVDADSPVVTDALEISYRTPAARDVPGIAELMSAQMLLDIGASDAAAQMMTLAWQHFEYDNGTQLAQDEFKNLTRRILWTLELEKDVDNIHGVQLREAATSVLKGQQK
ncbi:MAG: M48 family metallopeptidase [Chlamydiales bacterium]|nr:M48 family metallopeptidase [Chlamydiales bacterium]